jgi:RNA polymerase sigma-70 factor (ECF subfamily)
VFRSVAEHVAGFHRDRAGDTFRGWLRTITRNKVRDHYRRQHGQPRAAGGTDAQLRLLATAEPAWPDDDPEEEGLVSQQVRQALETIRPEFEERTWTAFRMVQLEGQDGPTVAAALGMTPGAVRKAKFRVLRRLREELEGLLD